MDKKIRDIKLMFKKGFRSWREYIFIDIQI